MKEKTVFVPLDDFLSLQQQRSKRERFFAPPVSFFPSNWFCYHSIFHFENFATNLDARCRSGHRCLGHGGEKLFKLWSHFWTLTFETSWPIFFWRREEADEAKVQVQDFCCKKKLWGCFLLPNWLSCLRERSLKKLKLISRMKKKEEGRKKWNRPLWFDCKHFKANAE